jgi:hypothetical protein
MMNSNVSYSNLYDMYGNTIPNHLTKNNLDIILSYFGIQNIWIGSLVESCLQWTSNSPCSTAIINKNGEYESCDSKLSFLFLCVHPISFIITSTPAISPTSSQPSFTPTYSKPTTSPSKSPNTSKPSVSPSTSKPTKNPTKTPTKPPTLAPTKAPTNAFSPTSFYALKCLRFTATATPAPYYDGSGRFVFTNFLLINFQTVGQIFEFFCLFLECDGLDDCRSHLFEIWGARR